MEFTKSNPLYFGLFIDRRDIPTPELECSPDYPHVTFGFKLPCPEEFIGKTYDIDVIGYANNMHNEAYLVRLSPELQEIYKGAAQPHITVSTSRFSRPVNSGKLPFKPLPWIFQFSGRIGYVLSDGIPRFE